MWCVVIDKDHCSNSTQYSLFHIETYNVLQSSTNEGPLLLEGFESSFVRGIWMPMKVPNRLHSPWLWGRKNCDQKWCPSKEYGCNSSSLLCIGTSLDSVLCCYRLWWLSDGLGVCRVALSIAVWARLTAGSILSVLWLPSNAASQLRSADLKSFYHNYWPSGGFCIVISYPGRRLYVYSYLVMYFFSPSRNRWCIKT